jgi:hypothetical protein
MNVLTFVCVCVCVCVFVRYSRNKLTMIFISWYVYLYTSGVPFSRRKNPDEIGLSLSVLQKEQKRDKGERDREEKKGTGRNERTDDGEKRVCTTESS